MWFGSLAATKLAKGRSSSFFGDPKVSGYRHDSKLLSTGADCKMTKLIVLDEMIGSMTEFKQIIGRGTRLREKEGKTHFAVMDFRNVTRLFADPDWDGPLEIDEEFGTSKGKELPPKEIPDGTPSTPDSHEKLPTPIVDEKGCKVRIIQKTVSIYDTDGKLLRQESIVTTPKKHSGQICFSGQLYPAVERRREKGSHSRPAPPARH